MGPWDPMGLYLLLVLIVLAMGLATGSVLSQINARATMYVTASLPGPSMFTGAVTSTRLFFMCLASRDFKNDRVGLAGSLSGQFGRRMMSGASHPILKLCASTTSASSAARLCVPTVVRHGLFLSFGTALAKESNVGCSPSLTYCAIAAKLSCSTTCSHCEVGTWALRQLLDLSARILVLLSS